MNRKLLALLPLLGTLTWLSSAGCQYDPYANRMTTVKPSANNLPGIYVLQEQTVTPEGLAMVDGKRSAIALRSDGTFAATNFPIWREPRDAGDYELDHLKTGTGHWQLQTVGTVQEGAHGSMTPVWGVRLDWKRGSKDASPSKSQWLDLTSDRVPYGLMDTIGDPDMGTVVLFRRDQPSPSKTEDQH